MRFAALGRTEYLYDTILALRDAGHEAGCVVTAPAAPEYLRREADFESLALDMGCPFAVSSGSLGPAEAELLRGCEVAVSVNWPYVLDAGVLGLFPHGVLNVHAGDLPRYRGNACPNWAILQGEAEVALSVHRMRPGEMDCGAVLAQAGMPLTDETYIADVNAWILATAPGLFGRALDALSRDPGFTLKVADAKAPEAFRCYPRVPEDGFIDWRGTARNIHRLVRASSTPLPGAYTYRLHRGVLEKVRVLRAELTGEALGRDLAEPGQIVRNERDSGRSLVACGDGALLALTQCRLDGGEPYAPGREWRSIRARLGARAEDVLWVVLKEQGKAR